MKNRHSNPPGVIPDFTPKNIREKKEDELFFKECVVCNGNIGYGYYGRWSDSGTCSKKCEIEQAQKPLDFGEPK